MTHSRHVSGGIYTHCDGRQHRPSPDRRPIKTLASPTFTSWTRFGTFGLRWCISSGKMRPISNHFGLSATLVPQNWSGLSYAPEHSLTLVLCLPHFQTEKSYQDILMIYQDDLSEWYRSYIFHDILIYIPYIFHDIFLYIYIDDIYPNFSEWWNTAARRCNAETAWAVASMEMSRCPRRHRNSRCCADGFLVTQKGYSHNVARGVRSVFLTPKSVNQHDHRTGHGFQ